MAAFGAAAMEGPASSPSSSRSSSSGCQSGWTLYLDHSDGAHRCIPYCAPATQRWVLPRADGGVDGDEGEEEDSMASDASSGPRPRPQHDGHDQRGRSCSAASVQRSRGGSGCLGDSSTWSRSSQGAGANINGGVVARKATVVTATSQYREIIVIDDDEDELDDTASSSSAVFSCPMPMVHARSDFLHV